MWFCILLYFKNFLLLKENIVDNHWCVLRSAQTMSKKIGDVFPTFFPLILCSHKQCVCHLWFLLSDYNPTVPLSQLSLFVGTFLFSYFFSVISNRTQPPLEFQKSCWRILSVCCSTMISISTISQRVCILLKGDVKVNEVRSSKMCVKCVVHARP